MFKQICKRAEVPYQEFAIAQIWRAVWTLEIYLALRYQLKYSR